MINPQWLELPMSRTNFHGPKDVRAFEVRRYIEESDYGLFWCHLMIIWYRMSQCIYRSLNNITYQQLTLFFSEYTLRINY